MEHQTRAIFKGRETIEKISRQRVMLGAGHFTTVCLVAWILATFSFPPLPLAKEEKTPALHQPAPGQPYPYQEIKTDSKKSVRIVGQAYRTQPDRLVLELLPQQSQRRASLSAKAGRSAKPPAQMEIQNVRIKTPDGKIYPANLRRLPADFLPTARKNYQHTDGEAPKAQYLPGSEQ